MSMKRTLAALVGVVAALCGVQSGACVSGVTAGERPLTTLSGATEPSESAEGEASESNGDGDGDTLTGDGDGAPENPISWLLNSEGGKLYKIDRYDASTTVLCDLIDPELGGSIEFSSMTFSRMDVLYGSHEGGLYEIVLPTCEVIKVGEFGGSITSVNGISPDEANGLYAIDTSTNAVYRIDPLTAISTLVGPAGYDIGFGGATWLEADQRLLAVDAGNDTLNEVDTETGAYTLLGNLSTGLNLVGFEHHPHGGNLYACSSGSAEGLWEIEPDGQMSYIGSIGFGCNDLAAPWLMPPLPD